MCNDYANHIPYSDYAPAFSERGIRIFAGGGRIPNLEPRDDIWPADTAPIIRRAGRGAAELAEMRWGFPPARPKGPPVFNFRSEGRRFERGRCLVPMSWFYEYTGRRGHKSKWRFTAKDGEWICVAGLWRLTDTGEAFTLLTTAPGPDVAPIHDRQIVVLARADWARWLDGETEPEGVLHASPAGTLAVEQVR